MKDQELRNMELFEMDSNLAAAVSALRDGRLVLLLDDEDRENEGDLVAAAELITPESVNFMITHGRGLVCLSMAPEEIDRLRLPMMATNNQSRFQTAFTVSIEAREGVTTGISAFERAHTIRTAANPTSGPEDLVSPGHIFPIRARSGGVLERRGQTEGSVDLAVLAGLRPAAVICEVLNADGTMARTPQLLQFSKQWNIPVTSVEAIARFRHQTLSSPRHLGQVAGTSP